MNKIISINLKGIIFQMEEQAYDRLKNYLETLNRHFSNEESRVEIIDDIEGRIAEMMQEKLKTQPAITLEDIEGIIAIMGNPSDFDVGEETTGATGGEQAKQENKYSYVPPVEKGSRRFYRDTEKGILGGVCSGMGHYFDIDQLWFRAGFLFLFFFMGTGVLLYLILWIIIPEAKSPSERLQMKGERVTVDNIEKKVKEEYERVKASLNNMGKSRKDPVVGGINKVAGIIKDIVVNLVRVFGKIIGIMLIIASVLLFVTVASMVVHFVITGSVPLLSLAFETAGEFWLTVGAIALLLVMIAVGLITTALSLINPRRKWYNKSYTITSGILSGIALVILVVMGVRYGTAFSHRQNIREVRALQLQNDTLVISAFNPILNDLFGNFNPAESHDYRSTRFRLMNMDFDYIKTASNAIKNDSLWCIARLEIQRTEKDVPELEIIRSAHGYDDYQAQAYAASIPVEYTMVNGKLTLNTHFYVGNKIPYRNQRIIYRLWLPKNKVVKFEQSAIEIMEYGLKRNFENEDNYGLTWMMDENGLRCLDCKSLYGPGQLNPEARYVHIKDFREVKINIPAKLTIIQGDDYKVSITGPDDVRDQIEVKKQGEKLVVDIDRNLFDFLKNNSSDVKIRITMPRLDKIEANGAANVYLEKIANDRLTVELNGACDIEGDINTGTLNLELNGGSEAELKGTAKTVNLDVMGASNYYGFGLIAETFDLDVSGAANAEVFATKEITGDITGASNVRYKGTPVLRTSATGASSIKAE